ncbi:hypothetical protein, partial [Candidatus Entotheonella palauensis]|uniref:hypothetical protein n=1 Tax=Candidatus Entotheonella palauensis TaxID=93172 RepID=UPI0015C434FE
IASAVVSLAGLSILPVAGSAIAGAGLYMTLMRNALARKKQLHEPLEELRKSKTISEIKYQELRQRLDNILSQRTKVA